jgi:hypothetical protein
MADVMASYAGDEGQARSSRVRYVPRRVGGEPGRFVEWVWFARGRITGVRELIAPTGSTVAAVVLGDPIQQSPVGHDTVLVADQSTRSGRG